MNKNVFLETEYWFVTLAEKDQRYLGRSYVSLKRSCDAFSGITEEEMLDFLALVQKFEALLKEELGATMFNWSCLMNNAYQEDNPEPQVHWHVRPRYQHKVVIGGKEFIDTEFGYHYDRNPEKNRKVSGSVLDVILQRLKKR